MAASPRRRTRSPGFLAAVPPRRIQVLFPDGSGSPEPLFGNGEDADDSIGMEALAPPLPAPPVALASEESDRLGHAIGELRQASERMGAALAANALEIGCLLARRIIETELKGDPALRLSLARAAVRRLGDAQKVTVHLSATDRDAVAAAVAAGESLGVSMARVEIVTDTNLSPGDSLVESDTSIVDGRLGTRLEELRRVLAAIVNSDGETS